jgi:hypothetical protein
MNGKKHTLITALLAAAAIGASLVGAGCAGKSGSGSTKSGEFVGRVTSVVHWKLPDEIYAKLTPEVRANLQTRGITVDDANRTMISKELPLVGHWVKIHENFYMTDQNGEFNVKGSIPTGGSVGVYAQLNSETAEGEIPISNLTLKGQTPPPTRLILPYYLPDDMDKHPEHTGPNGAKVGDAAATRGRATTGDYGHAPDGCDLRKACLPVGHPDGNKESCCLDYNGNLGDGLPRNRVSNDPVCTGKAVNNFVNSDCWLWTFEKPGRPCASEGGVNHYGPGCWMNHAYRNCQNLDENDFGITDKIKLPLVDKVQFNIRNNTPSYITWLRWKEPNVPGTLTLDANDPSYHATLIPITNGTGYKLYQYSDSKDTYYKDVKLFYISPNKLPNHKARETYHLIAEAGGHSREMEVEVVAIDRIEVTPTSASVKKGESVGLTAVAKDVNGKTIDWATPLQWMATGTGSVSQSGVVTGSSEGMVVVTVFFPEYPDVKGSATVTVTDDEPDPKPEGRHNLVSVNGKAPPVVVNEYYDKQLKYTWRMTIFPGYIDLHKDGTFASLHKGGDYNYPVAREGSGTYTINGNRVLLNYTSGSGPKEMTIIGAGQLAFSYVFEKDNVQFFQDVPVTEVYKLQ